LAALAAAVIRLLGAFLKRTGSGGSFTMKIERLRNIQRKIAPLVNRGGQVYAAFVQFSRKSTLMCLGRNYDNRIPGQRRRFDKAAEAN